MPDTDPEEKRRLKYAEYYKTYRLNNKEKINTWYNIRREHYTDYIRLKDHQKRRRRLEKDPDSDRFKYYFQRSPKLKLGHALYYYFFGWKFIYTSFIHKEYKYYAQLKKYLFNKYFCLWVYGHRQPRIHCYSKIPDTKEKEKVEPKCIKPKTVVVQDIVVSL